MARWQESQHPRWPAGSPGDVDGQFRPKGGARVRDLATLSRSTLLKYARERALVLPRGVDDDAIRQAIRRFNSGGGEDWAGQISRAVERKQTPPTRFKPDEFATIRNALARHAEDITDGTTSGSLEAVYRLDGKLRTAKSSGRGVRLTPADGTVLRDAFAARKRDLGEMVDEWASDPTMADSDDLAWAKEQLDIIASLEVGLSSGGPPKQAGDDLVIDTVQKLQAARSETEAIRILASDQRLRASALKKVAAALGIEVPEEMRAKTALQLHIASQVRRAAQANVGVPFNSRKHGPGTRVSWAADGDVTVYGTVVRKGRFTVIDWDTGRQESVRAGVDHPDIRVVPVGSSRQPRDMIDRDTAQAMLDRTGSREDVQVKSGMYASAHYWVDADPVLEEIVYDQWGGAPAAAVSADEFDRMRADRQIELVLYRGVEHGNAGITAEQVHAQMTRQGKTRLGNGIFGNGWYMATTRRHAETYGLTARFGLRADARTTTYEELVAEYEQWERKQRHRLGRSIEWGDRRESAYTSDKTGTRYSGGDPMIAAFGADLGRFAAARGYDAYRIKKGTSPGVGQPAGGNQWVVLNRGALIADTETRTGKAK